ncbi:hypothetical protein Tco_0138931 [Tanacetum coccineum]
MLAIQAEECKDKAIYEEWDDRVERDTTTAASLDAEQASGNINRTQSTTIPNVPLPQGVGAGGSPRCQEAMRGSIAQTRSERVPTPPRDSPLPRVNTLRSDEGSMTLQELTVLCTTLSKKVESLEADLKQTKQVYGAAYTKLIMKVKKLEKTVKTSHSRRRAKIVVSDDEEASEDSSKQGRMIEEIDQDADAAKINVYTYTRKRRREVSNGSGGISTASRLFSTVEESVSTAGASMPVSTTRMVQEANISIPSLVVIKDKARVEADEELSKRLQAEERNKYSEVDQAKMLVDLINQRKKYFAAQKAEAKRNKPMTQAQQRNYMINYIKHIGTGSSQATMTDFAEVGSPKRAAEAELDHEGSKRQKTNEASGSEVYTEESRKYWKIIRVGNHTEAYQFLEDMLKIFNRDDLVMLWNLVKERFSSTEPTDDKERTLWVKLKRLFEPNTDDILLLVEQHSEMANELLRKIFIQANRPRQ